MTAHDLSGAYKQIEGLCAVIDRAYSCTDALRATFSRRNPVHPFAIHGGYFEETTFPSVSLN